MPTVTMTLEEYEALMALVRSGDTNSLITSPTEPMPSGKPKRRRRSKYQKELGRQLKKLKKKHPRTKMPALMKRAHKATRKALK
jgi:hypothetical protein